MISKAANSTERPADDVDAYFAKVVVPGLAALHDDGDKATFLGDELTKWELAEDKLFSWAARDDGSPNPFSPPLDVLQTSLILIRLNKSLSDLRVSIRARIAVAEAILEGAHS